MIKLDRLGFDDDHAGIIADDCLSTYELHEGLRVIPVMGPAGTPPVVVRVHAAYTKRSSKFLYSRNKRPPIIPTPGDTQSGDIYLGGNIKLNSPTQDARSYLTYSVAGGYNFVCATDFRDKGSVRFDAHSYLSLVDVLGVVNINPRKLLAGEPDDVWQLPTFDLDLLGSVRILG